MHATIDQFDRVIARSQFRRQLIGLDFASSTIGRWRDPTAERGDYVAVSIMGDCVRCTDFERGERISSIDLTPDQWRHELAGMRMLGFVRD